MLQSEVVERLKATAGSAEYGPLAILVGAAANVAPVRTVPPSVFFPRPRVESTVVRIEPDARRRSEAGDLGRLRDVVHAGFRHRRKTLQRNLREVATTAQLEAAGLDPRARPETVAPEGWIALARVLAEAPAA